MDLFESFRRNREERPEQAAFLIASGDRSVPIAWRQFTDDIERVVHLIRKNAASGAVIGILGENSYEWMVAHAACLFSESVAVPLEVSLSVEEIVERLSFVKAVALVSSSLYADKAKSVGRRMPGLQTYGFGERKTDLYLDEAARELAEGGGGVFSGPAPDPSRVSMIVFTSGTTSEPRGAELSVRGIEAFGAFASEALPMKPGEQSLMLLPLHHIFGLVTSYVMLASGVALGVCPDFRRIYDAVERFRANYIFLVPALADILAAKIAQHGESAEGALGFPLDWVLIGGAPMAQSGIDRLTALGIRVLSAYGLTETTALYSILPVSRTAQAGCGGMSAAGIETKVSPAGELMVRGPNVMRGYYGLPEKTAEAIDAEGWFHTGDFGRIDQEGLVWITGRASRTIILSSGKKIAPEELEERIHAIPGVLEVVVGREDDQSRRIIAEIYASVGADVLNRAIAAMNQSLPVYKRISHVVTRTTPFPRTSSGKICFALTKSGRAAPRHSPVHRGRWLIGAFILFVTGIALYWLAEAIPDFFQLSGDAVSARSRRLFMCAGEIGESLIALAFLVAAVPAWRYLKARNGGE